MTTTANLNKANSSAQKIREDARKAFDNLELSTRSSLEEIKSNLKLMEATLKIPIADLKIKILDYFQSDKFLKIEGEQVQFDAEVRAELKYHAQYSPSDGKAVINFNQILWNPKKAAAALRQDSEKHMTVTPVSKQDKWKLQRMVLMATEGAPKKLVEELDRLENEISQVEAALYSFDDANEFYDFIFN